ncbi:MAG TPA: radical SAM family heme chaperone HemW [Steroidobacteraceae bacterium]|nr:radical SAM family heme chaperone HemW [Steroidobacteraceae bacterium]
MIDVTRIPLSLYVHLPWCVSKCPYCDFNSHAVPSAGLPEDMYVAALLDDLEFAARDVAGREIVSVFFGGGTPSLFSAGAIRHVLDRARALLPFAADVEVTLEANPGTVEHGRFVDYAAAGVNRVSLGAQSFDDATLRALGRIHASVDIERAVTEVRAAGIDRLNLDLMYALPGQDVAGALGDLERAIALQPTHLSHYQLTLEPGTPFARRPPARLPDDDASLQMQEACQARLAAAGFEQYEVSAYARPGHRCRHNLGYWRFDDYLGVGAGAHGKVTLPDGSIVRTVRARHPGSYLAAATPPARVTEQRAVPVRDVPFEFCLNALRLDDGFADPEFAARTGLSTDVMSRPLAEATRRGLLGYDGERWRPTGLGRRFLNDLQGLFLPG